MGQQLEYATQAKLYNYPDSHGAAAGIPVPEVAAGMPQVSTDGRTVTIRIRPGFRFSPAVEQTRHGGDVPLLSSSARSPPGIQNGIYFLPELVGARAPFLDGRATHISGLTASGDTITMHFTKPVLRPAAGAGGAVLYRGSRGTPAGADRRADPSAGPYYVRQPRLVRIVRRNPNYGGAVHSRWMRSCTRSASTRPGRRVKRGSLDSGATRTAGCSTDRATRQPQLERRTASPAGLVHDPWLDFLTH